MQNAKALYEQILSEEGFVKDGKSWFSNKFTFSVDIVGNMVYLGEKSAMPEVELVTAHSGLNFSLLSSTGSDVIESLPGIDWKRVSAIKGMLFKLCAFTKRK